MVVFYPASLYRMLDSDSVLMDVGLVLCNLVWYLGPGILVLYPASLHARAQ